MILPASGGPAAGGRATLMPGTRDLARHQFVSENTVQDHLNSIFTRPPPATGAAYPPAPLAPDTVIASAGHNATICAHPHRTCPELQTRK